MRFIPVPEAAMRQYPHCRRIVMAPPDGDFLNSEVRAADVLRDDSGFRVFFVLEEGDLSEIARFKQVYLELFIMGGGMPPVSLISWPDVAMGLKSEAFKSTDIAPYDELSEDDVIELQRENLRMREALRRLGSMEAFHVASAHVSEELKLRVQYARDALENG